MREALAKKWKYKIPGEIIKIEEVEIPQEKVKVPDSVEKTAKKLIKKYDKIGGETKFKNIVDANKKKKKNDFINKINSSAKKNALITAKKIVQKYKLMKKPKKKHIW